MAPEDRRRELVLSHKEDGDLEHGSIFFVGTATVILRYAGFTILTDPNFLHAGDHVHLGYGLRSRRLTEPAFALEQLPPVDFVLLSHLHGDHFDQLVEKRLNRDIPILTTRHAAFALRARGFRRTHGIPTFESVRIRKGGAMLDVTAMPGKHAPGLLGLALPPVMGSMLEFRTNGSDVVALRLYISGDTLMHADLGEIPRRYPHIDVGLFHLGGTRIMGVLLTMDAKQGVQAVKLIKPEVAIPIHYNDYTVFKSPLDDFRREVEHAGLQERVHYLAHGETYQFEVPASRIGARAEGIPAEAPPAGPPAVSTDAQHRSRHR